MRVKNSLSAIFGIFCLLAFTFPDSGEGGKANATENVATNASDNVCDNQVYEYFYTSSLRFRTYCDTVYNQLFNSSNRPTKRMFEMALKGYAHYAAQGLLAKKDILTFIDYSLSSNVKRLWVVDLGKMKVLFHELVAHGRNSGEEYARKFSNVTNSFQTSLGFFVTGEIYNGKHERSIKMQGLERKFNSNAMDRGIVIHGADYVSYDFIKQNKRLGRSLGCPAVSMDVIDELSSVIANGTCLFAYYPNKSYLKMSSANRFDALFASKI
jgi:hypothetical protein